MRILADENIPLQTVQALRRLGHDVLDFHGREEKGATDERLWERAQREGRLIVTTDKGFASRRSERHHGLLVIRLRQPNRTESHVRILQALNEIPQQDWPGLLVVMRDTARSLWREADQ